LQTVVSCEKLGARFVAPAAGRQLTMNILHRSRLSRWLPLLAVVSLVAGSPAAQAAEPVAELAAFSVFGNVDSAALLKGDVKTSRGPAMSSSRDLSVQSVYVVPGPPAKAIEALRGWNPAQHRELKILLHSDVSGSPGAASFAGKLRSAPASGPVRSLAEATEKMSNELQISNEEAKKFAAGGRRELPGGGRALLCQRRV